jgi:hypothetical protein
MANLNRGEISVAAASGPVTLAIDFNALCALEEQGHDLEALAEAAQAGKLIPLRRIIRAAMLKHRPDATEIDAGNLATEIGIAEMAAAIGRLFKASGLVTEETDSGNAKRAPRRARRTG